MRQITPILIIFLCLSGCNPATFYPIYENQSVVPVVKGYLETDSVLRIRISGSAESFGSKEETFLDSVKNAKVQISINNGTPIDLYAVDRSSFFAVHEVDFRSENIKVSNTLSKYALEITIPGFPSIKATSEGFVSQSTLEFQETTLLSAELESEKENELLFEGKIELELRTVTQKSFFIAAFANWNPIVKDLSGNGSDFSISLQTSPEFVRDFSNESVSAARKRYPYQIVGFKGTQFNNGALSFEVRFPYPGQINPYSGFVEYYRPDFFIIYEVEEHVFEFFRLVNLEFNTNNIPISEPVQIPFNMSNAFGIFGRVHPVVTIPLSKRGEELLQQNAKIF